jgi:hypothetical protein
MCRCAGEQRRAGIGRTADRAKPMRTQVRKASKGLPVPARRRSPQPGPTTARRAVDHALRQARRRCQRGTYVPMRWRAAPCRDRAHGRPSEADADEGPQGQQGAAGARTQTAQPGPTTARRAVDHALRQARRRCQRGTHVPMRWRAAPRRLFVESATKKGGRSPPDHFRMKAT